MTSTSRPLQGDDRVPVDSLWLVERLDDVSWQGIAAGVSRLIRTGELKAGIRLPAVRELASQLHVSPATVSAAWGALRKQALIAGRGRQGSWVADVIRGPGPKRFENITTYWSGEVLDLSLAVPDPKLMPDLRAAIAASAADPELGSYHRPSITRALLDAVRPGWSFDAEDWLAVNGGYEGVRLILSSTIVPGDFVAVSDPSAPRLIDILEHVGARILPVAVDNEGPLPASLAVALKRNPAAFLYEPRTSSRLGISLSQRRRAELLRLLRPSKVLIVEDDGTGDLSATAPIGFGGDLPDRTVVIRSFSKSHSPDLRIAVIGGAGPAVDRARSILQFGAGWVSRLLQNALAFLLTDAESITLLDHARENYRERRETMIRLLAERGVRATGDDGLSISVHVANEQQALLVLASHGIASDPGSSASVSARTSFVRLGIGTWFDEPERVADSFALAAKAL